MNFNCYFYSQTLSKCLAYSQYVLVYLKKVETDKESDFNNKI